MGFKYCCVCGRPQEDMREYDKDTLLCPGCGSLSMKFQIEVLDNKKSTFSSNNDFGLKENDYLMFDTELSPEELGHFSNVTREQYDLVLAAIEKDHGQKAVNEINRRVLAITVRRIA